MFKGTGYDSQGNVIKCDKCPNNAGGHIVGLDWQANYCGDHLPFESTGAKFVYKPNLNQTEQPINKDLTKDMWVVDFTKELE